MPLRLTSDPCFISARRKNEGLENEDTVRSASHEMINTQSMSSRYLLLLVSSLLLIRAN